MGSPCLSSAYPSLQEKEDAGIPHSTLDDRCIQDKCNEGRPSSTSDDRCAGKRVMGVGNTRYRLIVVQAKVYRGRQPLTFLEIWLQAIGDARSPCPTMTKPCAQTMVNARSPRLTWANKCVGYDPCRQFTSDVVQLFAKGYMGMTRPTTN